MIRLSKSSIKTNEKEQVLKVLDEEFLGMGKYVESFERKLDKFFGRKTSCVVNGTAALHLALQAIGVKFGDEIIVPSLTYVATYQAISACGALPISCDVSMDNLCIDPAEIEKNITSKTKAIIIVHYAGLAENIGDVLNIGKKYGIRVIEDAAHAFGSSIKGHLIGSFGDIACFSFDGIKNITSGEGGCVVSNDSEVISSINEARLLGVIGDTKKRFEGRRSWDFDVRLQGWRYHMSNIMAAIGIEQFKRREKIFEARRCLARHYDLLLCKTKVKTLEKNYSEVVPHIYPVIVPKEVNRDQLRQTLFDLGIETGVHYKPNHLLSMYKQKRFKLSVTEKVYPRLLSLPLHEDLSKDQIGEVVYELTRNL